MGATSLGVAREVLRDLVVSIAKAILEKQEWPPAIEAKEPLRLWFGVTPHHRFKMATITSSTDNWRVKVLEANPAKVVRARDKVMVYFERPFGRQIRTGQVRRQQGRYDLHWFDN